MEFNVGNKVKLINGGNQYPLYGFINGGIYEVIGKSKTEDSFGGDARERIKISGGSNYGYALPQDLKLILPKLTKNQRLTSLEERVSTLEEIAQQLQENNITIDDVKKYFTLPSTFEIDGKQLSAASIIGATIEPFTVDDVLIKNEIIEFEGNMYQKVGREAREGDVAVPFGSIHSFITDGKPYKLFNGRYAPSNLSHIANSGSEYRFDNNFLKGWTIYELIQPSTSSTVEGKQDVHSTTFTLGGKHSDDHNAVQDVQRQTVPCAVAKTPNELRAEVIEKAKGFVDENGGDDYHFEVDEEKRTVFAWKIEPLKRSYYAKCDLATCHPNDVFNADIGKAIAFGRAEGLDVSEFEQAVQPTEIVLGMQVINNAPHNKTNANVAITVCEPGSRYDEAFENGERKGAIDSPFMKNRYTKIINDTNAIYGGVE